MQNPAPVFPLSPGQRRVAVCPPGNWRLGAGDPGQMGIAHGHGDVAVSQSLETVNKGVPTMTSQLAKVWRRE